MRQPAFAVLAAAVLAGCGSKSSHKLWTDDTVAQALVQGIHDKAFGSRLTGTSCVKRTAREYLCSGTLHVSRQAARHSYPGVDRSGWTDADYEAVRKQQSGTVQFDVVVDGDRIAWSAH